MTEVEAKDGFDRVFNYVGSCGAFQIVLLFIVSIQSIILSWHHLGYVFLGAVPDHWCHLPEFDTSSWSDTQIRNVSIPMKGDGKGWESCEYYDLNYTILASLPYEKAMLEVTKILNSHDRLERKQCSSWVFDTSTYASTIVTEFEIVCDRRYLVATIQATYMGGVFIGSLIIGSLSDRIIGRRKSVLISIVLVLVAGIAAGFAKTYWLLIFFRFFVAFGVAGAYQNCFVLLMEYVGPKSRSSMGMIQQLPFAVGYMLMALLAYYIRDWQLLQITFSAIGILLLSYFWLLPESVRWLAVSGQPEESVQLLLEVARRNGKEGISPEPLFDIVSSCSQVKPRRTATFSIADTPPQPPTNNCLESGEKVWTPLKEALLVYWSLVATPEMRRRTLLIWILFISVDLVYYGVIFDSATLTKDPFLLVFLGGLSEVPAYTFFVPCLSRWGRRPTIVLTYFFTACSTLLVAYIPTDQEILRTCVSMTGKLFITTAFAVIYLLGTELYPTSTRTTGLAAAVFMGRVGSILAPYVVDGMKNVYSDLPNIIFGVVCILSSLVSLLIPETNGVEMADKLSDVEEGFASPKKKTEAIRNPVDETISSPSNNPNGENLELRQISRNA